MTTNEKFLAHYGRLGMRWGVRRTAEQLKNNVDPETVRVTRRKGSKKLSSSGGESTPPNEQAVRVAANKQKAKAAGTNTLSTNELNEIVARFNAEKAYAEVRKADKSAGRRFAEELVKDLAKQEFAALAKGQSNGPISELLALGMGKRGSGKHRAQTPIKRTPQKKGQKKK